MRLEVEVGVVGPGSGEWLCGRFGSVGPRGRGGGEEEVIHQIQSLRVKKTKIEDANLRSSVKKKKIEVVDLHSSRKKTKIEVVGWIFIHRGKNTKIDVMGRILNP